MLKTGAYRPEIDGLRAIAVLSILFFHLGIDYFPGGYIGVDVFFVISGYLISRSILADIEAQRFSLRRFYYRRARRLFPAYSVALVFTAFASALLLSSEHLYRFGQALLSSLFWVSNIFFWSESGYFDISSGFKPLLHTWSLSVEEQFYLLWPTMMLLLLSVRSKLFAPVILLLLSMVSLLLAEYWLTQNSSTAFYWLPFRVFEFGLGALVIWAEKRFVIHRDRYKNAAGLVGLGMIAYAALTFDALTPFPGLHALYPCLGAALLIYAGESTFSRIFLQNSVSIFVGLISYSVYLVHWPIIVLYGYWDSPVLSVMEQYTLGAVSIAAGFLLWKCVEQPFRYGSTSSLGVINAINSHFLKHSAAVFVICAMTAASMWAFNGWPWRFDGPLLTAEEVETGKRKRYEAWASKGCHILDFPEGEHCKKQMGGANVFTTLVLGNSHSLDGYNIWKSAFGKLPDHQIVWFGSTNKCRKFRGIKEKQRGDSEQCFERFSVLDSPTFLNQLDVLVFSSRDPFSRKKEPDYQLFQEMKATNPKIRFVILGDYLSTHTDCSHLYNRYQDFSICASPDFLERESDAEVLADNRSRYSSAVETLKPFIIDKYALLCGDNDPSSCKSQVDGVPFAYDRHHLSFEFAVYLGQLIHARYLDEFQAMGLIPETPGALSAKETRENRLAE